MSVEEIIKQKLTEKFQPDILQVENESYKHIGHAGDDGSGESHFKVTISSAEFSEDSRLQAHRKINACLAEELKNTIHALSLHVIKA
mgnify:CR=1 FL=1